jgi:hypothetical protein
MAAASPPPFQRHSSYLVNKPQIGGSTEFESYTELDTIVTLIKDVSTLHIFTCPFYISIITQSVSKYSFFSSQNSCISTPHSPRNRHHGHLRDHRRRRRVLYRSIDHAVTFFRGLHCTCDCMAVESCKMMHFFSLF